jgi:uncharacterized SAM-binding protein YcdF (DUF218 family)
MEVLIVLTLIGNVWLIAPRRWRHRVISPLAIMVLVYVLMTSSIVIELAFKAMVLPLPRDSGDSATMIVVLGRGEPFRKQRVEQAAQLWQSQRAPKIFASGMMDASSIIDDLKNRGIPAQNLNGETCSQTTEENALFTAAILSPQTYRKIFLVTDPPHLLRSFLVFQSLGYSPIPVMSAFPAEFNSNEKVSAIVREVAGLIVYAFAGKLNLQTPENLASSLSTVAERLNSWKCKL